MEERLDIDETINRNDENQELAPIVNKIWYHGTTKNNLFRIKKDGFFREGTWFARHMEDAREFGGHIVVQVNVFFDVYESEWQVCSQNKIPVSVISDIFRITKKTPSEKLRRPHSLRYLSFMGN